MVTKIEAAILANEVEYTGYTTLRVFEDGAWISPAGGLQPQTEMRSWDFSWTVEGYCLKGKGAI